MQTALLVQSPKDWNWGGCNTRTKGAHRVRGIDGAAALGLQFPFTREDVRKAYKRLAKTAHPDLGGTNEMFHLLKDAHDAAMQFATA